MTATAPNTSPAPAPRATRAERVLGRTLRAERVRLLETLRAHAEAQRALGEAQDGSSGWWQEATVASDLVAEETLAALDHGEQRRLSDVEAALRRLTRGHYGVCEACGRPVPAARLRAIPWTRRCVDCAGRLEETRRGSSAAGRRHWQ